jgi:hypothetical protein
MAVARRSGARPEVAHAWWPRDRKERRWLEAAADALAAAHAGATESLTMRSPTKPGVARARDGGDEGADVEAVPEVLAKATGSARRRLPGCARREDGEAPTTCCSARRERPKSRARGEGCAASRAKTREWRRIQGGIGELGLQS